MGNLEQDLNAIIFMFYDNYTEEDIAEVLTGLFLQYNFEDIIHNLKTRNRTPVIVNLLYIIVEYEKALIAEGYIQTVNQPLSPQQIK